MCAIVDLRELVGVVIDIAGECCAFLLAGTVVPRVVGIGFGLRTVAIADLGEAVEGIVTIGIVNGRAIDGLVLIDALTKAIVGEGVGTKCSAGVACALGLRRAVGEAG